MALNGVIGKPGDVDHFVFKANKGQVLRHPLLRPPHPLAARPGDVPGQEGGRGDARRRRLGRARQLLPLPGARRRRVRHLAGRPARQGRARTTPTGSRSRPVAPKLTMSTAAEQIPLGTGVMSVAVPKGNRQAILIYGNRADFGGELNVGVGGLPAGRDGRGRRRWPPASRSSRCCSRPSPTRRWPAALADGRPASRSTRSSRSPRSSADVDAGARARTTSTSGRGRSTAWPSPSPRSARTRSRSSSPRCRWSGAARWA